MGKTLRFDFVQKTVARAIQYAVGFPNIGDRRIVRLPLGNTLSMAKSALVFLSASTGVLVRVALMASMASRSASSASSRASPDKRWHFKLASRYRRQLNSKLLRVLAL